MKIADMEIWNPASAGAGTNDSDWSSLMAFLDGRECRPLKTDPGDGNKYNPGDGRWITSAGVVGETEEVYGLYKSW